MEGFGNKIHEICSDCNHPKRVVVITTLRRDGARNQAIPLDSQPSIIRSGMRLEAKNNSYAATAELLNTQPWRKSGAGVSGFPPCLTIPVYLSLSFLSPWCLGSSAKCLPRLSGQLFLECRIAGILTYCYAERMTKVITVNGRGALTLPKEARERLGVTHGGQLVVDMDESGEVVLRAGVVMPVEIYSAARAEEFHRMNESPLVGKKLRWRKAQ